MTSQLAESQLAECLYVGGRNRVRVRDRFRDGVRDRMLGFGELGRNRVSQFKFLVSS